MRSEEKFGRKDRRNKDGTRRAYWVARHDLVKAGYEPKTVRLHYPVGDPAGEILIDAACRRLQAEMLAWAAGAKQDYSRFDGTIAGLVRLYQRDEASPYAALKWNTRRTYDDVLDKIELAFGKRALGALRIADFRRWYDEARKPLKPGGTERVRKAHGIVQMLRRLLSYGVMAELPECARLKAILDEARFKQPGRRRVRLELAHVEAFIATALEHGRWSLAFGTALQFECGMRQKDVIGEWAPVPDGQDPTGIVLKGRKGKVLRRWVNGLTWADLGDGTVFVKETTKTGALVAHDLSLMPLVTALLPMVPAAARIGPIIVDEAAGGRPYAEHGYAREWRRIARLAGIPDHVRNMDARAGAITEAEDAGAPLDDIRSFAGHTQASTTSRYSRGARGKSEKVAALRAAHRQPKNGG